MRIIIKNDIIWGDFLGNVVTNRQIFFILLLTITGYSLISIPKDAIKAAGTGAWFTVILLTIIFSIGMVFISKLNNIFLGKTLFEYSKILIGEKAGNIINIFYTLYFLFVSLSLTRNITEFINECYLPLTPIWALVLLILTVCIYISFKGITNIGRLCEIYGSILILVAFTIHTVMFFAGDITYIQPFFETNKIKDYIFGMKDLVAAFLGIEVFTIIPFGNNNKKKSTLISIIPIIFVGVFYIIVIETSTMIVGIKNIVLYNNSIVEALREVHLPGTFLLERVDFLFLTIGVFGIIAALSIVLFCASEYLSKLVPKIQRENIFLALGIALFIVSSFVISYETSMIIFNLIVPILGVITAFVIPITLYTIAKVKKYES